MKIAILGASGFLGYDFFRLLDAHGMARPEYVTIFTSFPGSLVNLARHPIHVRYVPAHLLGSESPPAEVDAIVNFSHPFAERDGLDIQRQTGLLADFLCRAMSADRKTRLVHVSTMSVYEPFSNRGEVSESAPLHPPRSDPYARTKAAVEQRLIQAVPGERLLILRPTVVYGPFSKYWTDDILQLFHTQEQLRCGPLRGRVQPLLGRDLSHVILAALQDWRSGIYNVPGPEAVAWREFYKTFEKVVGHARIEEGQGSVPTTRALLQQLVTDTAKTAFQHRNFVPLALKAYSLFPPALRRFSKNTFRQVSARTQVSPPEDQSAGPGRSIGGDFFETDRLVSDVKFKSAFPEIQRTRLPDTIASLRDYYRYRYDTAA